MTNGYTKDGYPCVATYDAENRMTALTYTGVGNVVYTTAYVYSGDGLLGLERKYENTVLTQETRFVRDGGLVVQDRDASNTVTNAYTWGLSLGGGIGGLLNLKQSGQNYAYLYDGSGNVEAVLNSSQAIVAAYRYDPFGKLEAQTGSLSQPYLFSTKRYDANIGMLLYEFRPYIPGIGRWASRDPLGEVGGLNLYAFVGNNPVNWVDPWGLTGVETAIAIGTGISAWCAANPSACERAVAAGLAVVSVALIHIADIPIVYRTPPIDIFPLPMPLPTEGGGVCEAPPVVPYLPYFPSPDTWTATREQPEPLQSEPQPRDCGFWLAMCKYYLGQDVGWNNAGRAIVACSEYARCVADVFSGN